MTRAVLASGLAVVQVVACGGVDDLPCGTNRGVPIGPTRCNMLWSGCDGFALGLRASTFLRMDGCDGISITPFATERFSACCLSTSAAFICAFWQSMIRHRTLDKACVLARRVDSDSSTASRRSCTILFSFPPTNEAVTSTTLPVPSNETRSSMKVVPSNEAEAGCIQ